ncbi:MAG: hypothetical protein IJG36_08125 [Synergistaceae bacterium]|nr:hypothetical protein [Synergistaceae bacterium]
MTIEREKLEEYISGLSINADSKRKHRKAITGFLAILEENGKSLPEQSDYAEYQKALTEKGQQETTAKDNARKAEKYFAWLRAQEVSCTEKESAKSENRTERFSLMLSPSLRERLEMLAQFDECSITEIIIGACEKVIAERASDIEYVADFKRGRDERKAKRKGG